MSVKFLYGASVQGIQSFIFKTNRLKEIIGASELVEQICTTKFYQISGLSSNSEEIILSAAGNIKCIADEEKCRNLVLNFPREILKFAPGVTISQAVVKFQEGDSLPLQELENRLKVQRNKLSSPLEIGFMGLERDRRTGGVAHEISSTRKGVGEFVSKQTYLKQLAAGQSNDLSTEKLFNKISGKKSVNSSCLSFDIENITESGKNSWIAVVHADGNGLGKIIQTKGDELIQNKEFKKFSESIENATKFSVQKAFNTIIERDKAKVELNSLNYRYPIRPIVLGGDDLSVIIRADLAVPFTECFLREFELKTKELFSNLKTKNINGLTACAGIAFVKESYPLHYALKLSEDLCKDAKNKSRKESSIAFYKVQESFIDDIDALKERTLKTKGGLSYYAGPYNLDQLSYLNEKLEVIRKVPTDDKTKAVGKLRQIITETYKDKSTAVFMLERMKLINSDFYDDLELDIEKEKIKIHSNEKSLLLDLITLDSFNYGNNEN